MAIKQNEAGQMVMSTKDFNFVIIDQELQEIQSWSLNDFMPEGINIVDVTDVFCDPIVSDRYWFTTREGIATFDAGTEELHFEQGIQWRPIRFFYDSLSYPYLWVSLERLGGLLKINLDHTSDRMYYSLAGSRTSANMELPDIEFTLYLDHIVRKSPTQLYVGTLNKGLAIFSTRSGDFDFQQHYSHTLVQDDIRSLYTNSLGEVWISSDENGLFYLRPEISQVHLKMFSDNKYSHGRNINSLLDLGNDKYLISNEFHPFLWIWDRLRDKISSIPLDHTFHYGTRIAQTHRGIMVGTNRGFYHYDATSNAARHDPLKINQDLKNINGFAITDSAFWYINWGNGIGKFDSVNHLITPSADGLQHAWTHDMAIGPDGNLWVGQENGLYEVNAKTMAIDNLSDRANLREFGNPNFKALAFDQYDRLWTGNFGAGIYCYDAQARRIIHHFSIQDGLPSDRVYDLFIDKNDIMWIWTSEGLSSLVPSQDLSQAKIRYYPDTKYIPVGRNGIWFDQLDNGEIYFGINGGMAYFDPQKLHNTLDKSIPAPIVTGVKVFNEPLEFSMGGKWPEGIDLAPHQNFIAISFSAPHAGFISQLEFEHRLDGVDENWVHSGEGRTASYTDLDPGTYSFRSRVKTEQGIWSASSYPLDIYLAAPWYATTLAKSIWALVIGLLLYGVNRFLVFRERMRNQLAMQQLEAKNLRELDVAKSHFFTQISHEFRTPLTVILGMVEHLQSQSNVSKGWQKAVQTIERNGQLLLRQINQILDLSKLQSKSIDLVLIQGDIIAFIKYLLESFEHYAKAKSLTLTFNSSSASLYMDFDPDRIQEILNNLISNALKYTPENGKIIVSSEIKKINKLDHLVLQVSDNGPGISEENLIKIFEPYYQVGNQTAGTGLGLATARQWAQAMGGYLEAQSQHREGSTFTLAIPISNNAERSAVFPSTFSPIDEVAVNHQPTTATREEVILIIEDNPDVIAYLNLCLQEYRLLSAQDGDEGIKQALVQVPDLIISDIMMPKKDGYEVCAALKSNHITSHIPIIMLTAKATQEERKSGLSLGAEAYLIKPFDREELLIRVKGLLDQRKILQQKYAHYSVNHAPDLQLDTEDEFIDQITQYVHSHLQESFSVEKLADHLHMSRVQLYRKTKALTGKSIATFIRLVRLYEARKMLQTGDKAISEVAYDVGFSDPSYFTKAFKEEFGNLPSDISQKPVN